MLEAIIKEDRERFFAEPVTVEYALATSYHSVVDQPMDFKTMRLKVADKSYGDVQVDALSRFRDDFTLICTNAQAFHRPNERCHLVAKRLLKTGHKVIDTTFPWLKADLAGEGADGAAGGELAKGAAGTGKEEEERGLSAEEAPPLSDSPWHHLASVSFGATAEGAPHCDSCFVCGGLTDAASPWLSDARMLRCAYCAETYHSYCTPAPCPEPNEENALHWACPRCRLLGIAPTQSADVPVNLPPLLARCARCDKVVQRKTTEGAADASGGGIVVCTDCRCCEGCGVRGGRGWSDDGVWCAACAPGGLEERFCGVCARVYADDSHEAGMMVCCDTCQVRVGPYCYLAYTDVYVHINMDIYIYIYMHI